MESVATHGKNSYQAKSFKKQIDNLIEKEKLEEKIKDKKDPKLEKLIDNIQKMIAEK